MVHRAVVYVTVPPMTLRSGLTDIVLYTAVAALLAGALPGCESVPPGAKCQAVGAAADLVAADIWEHDFPKLVPAWSGDPEAAYAHCTGILDELGVAITTKPKGQTSSTAAFTHVAMDPSWKSWSDTRTAAIMCHETLHILGQHRMGFIEWTAVYATTPGRIAAEGVAYATSDSLQYLWGRSLDREERIEKMPKKYHLSVGVECVTSILDRYLDELM